MHGQQGFGFLAYRFRGVIKELLRLRLANRRQELVFQVTSIAQHEDCSVSTTSVSKYKRRRPWARLYASALTASSQDPEPVKPQTQYYN